MPETGRVRQKADFGMGLHFCSAASILRGRLKSAPERGVSEAVTERLVLREGLPGREVTDGRGWCWNIPVFCQLPVYFLVSLRSH